MKLTYRPSSRLLSTIALVLAAVGCDSGAADAPVEKRSDAVLATGDGKVAKASAPAPSTAPAPSAALRRGPLCSSAKGKLPLDTLDTVSRRGSTYYAPPLARTKPAWINLWAAWCEPCKEEIPLLIEWHTSLAKKGIDFDLVFVSLDDDDRQLQRFLDAQQHLAGTFHLAEGKERDGWLEAFGLTSDVRLPVQLLVAPGGELACQIDGAVARSDEAAIAEVLGKLRP